MFVCTLSGCCTGNCNHLFNFFCGFSLVEVCVTRVLHIPTETDAVAALPLFCLCRSAALSSVVREFNPHQVFNTILRL